MDEVIGHLYRGGISGRGIPIFLLNPETDLGEIIGRELQLVQVAPFQLRLTFEDDVVVEVLESEIAVSGTRTEDLPVAAKLIIDMLNWRICTAIGRPDNGLDLGLQSPDGDRTELLRFFLRSINRESFFIHLDDRLVGA